MKAHVCDCVVGMGYDGLGGCPDEVKRSMLLDWDEDDIAFDSFCRNCGRNLKPEREPLVWVKIHESGYVWRTDDHRFVVYTETSNVYLLYDDHGRRGLGNGYSTDLAAQAVAELVHQTECGGGS